MRELPKSIYLTSDEIDVCIKQREAQVISLPPGQSPLELRREIARLQIYGDMKRLLVLG